MRLRGIPGSRLLMNTRMEAGNTDHAYSSIAHEEHRDNRKTDLCQSVTSGQWNGSGAETMHTLYFS